MRNSYICLRITKANEVGGFQIVVDHDIIFLQPNQWNEVILRYDGYSFSAAIDKVSKTIFVEGKISLTQEINTHTLLTYC